MTVTAVPLGTLLEGDPLPVVSDPRQTSRIVHEHLRRLIMSGTLPPGTELKQTELASLLAVSRTPMREAFRMLQEERLIDADLNQRARVAEFDSPALDSLYAARIALESLGARATTGALTPAESRDAKHLLREMGRAGRARDLNGWAVVHQRFHAVLTVRAGDLVGRTIASYAAQSERYWRLYGMAHPVSFADRHVEHEALLAAVLGDDRAAAAGLMACHLERTALAVLAEFDPGHRPVAVSAAVDLVMKRSSRPA